mmetsp:Transcript_13202/g.33512  ORF Transcript_13202/g.33512 Transcript_13202/m.33512 type:complete len:285 (+) Transcript_13202:480-1334(+)
MGCVAEQADPAVVPSIRVAKRARRDGEGARPAGSGARRRLENRVARSERRPAEEMIERLRGFGRVACGGPLLRCIVAARNAHRLHPHECAARPAALGVLVAAEAEPVRNELAVAEVLEQVVRQAEVRMRKRPLKVEDYAVEDALAFGRIAAEGRRMEAQHGGQRALASELLARRIDRAGGYRMNTVRSDEDVSENLLARAQRRRHAVARLAHRGNVAGVTDALLLHERAGEHIYQLGPEHATERLSKLLRYLSERRRASHHAPARPEQRHRPQRMHELLDLGAR